MSRRSSGAGPAPTPTRRSRRWSATSRQRCRRHFSAISMNERLFARIDDLYQRREALKLDAETLRVLEKTWKGFVRSGAKLDADGKKRLANISEELSSLGTNFGQNVLADERDWALFLDEADLAGLPDFVKSSMAEAAEMRGQKGRYAVTLSRSIYEPFTTFSERRDLREIAFRAFTMRGQNGGATDNTSVVRDMLTLRAEKAKLLGYDSFAALKLDDTMAKTPKAVHAPARSGLGEGAGEGSRRPDRTAAAGDRGRQQRNIRRLGLALLSGEAACREIRLRRGGAEALSAARPRHRRLLRRGHETVRHHFRGEEGHCRLASRRARLRGEKRRRQRARPVPRRLFRPVLEALRRLDERAEVRLPVSAMVPCRSSTTS